MLELGLDDSRDGWRYRGRLVKPGVYFAFATERYEATGQVEALTILDGAKGGPS